MGGLLITNMTNETSVGCGSRAIGLGSLAMRSFTILFAALAVLFLSACASMNRQTRHHGATETGEYIPRDLDDALAELDRIMGAEGRDEVMKATQDEMSKYHFGIGVWLRNNWLRGESRLSEYFRQLGIQHRDDMSGIILDSYWRKLHGKPIDLEGQVRHYQDYWKKEKANEVQ